MLIEPLHLQPAETCIKGLLVKQTYIFVSGMKAISKGFHISEAPSNGVSVYFSTRDGFHYFPVVYYGLW